MSESEIQARLHELEVRIAYQVRTIEDLAAARDAAEKAGAMFIVVADPVACALLKPPGEFGADIVVGEGQPMGVAIGLGGFGQTLHLGVGEKLSCAQIGVFRPTWHDNCSFYVGRRRAFHRCFGHVFLWV